MTRPGGQRFAHMCDAGVWSGSIKPDPFHAIFKLVFSEFIVLGSIDNLVHVWISHWEDDIARVRVFTLSSVGHEEEC